MLEEFIYLIANLKDTPRQGWVNKLGINRPESVADHCFSMTAMAMVLADLQKLDSTKIVKMSLLHDLAESKTGDLTPEKISRAEKKELENKTMKQILSNLPKNISKEYLQIWNEYQKKETENSIFIHEVDKLEMALQALIYLKKGHSKKKIRSFIETAESEIKNPRIREILSKLLAKPLE